MNFKELLDSLFSISKLNETHKLIRFLGIKIKIPEKEFAEKKSKSPYYYYKKNNINITTIPQAEGQIRDIQLANLRLLLELDYVCKSNGLQYWLDGGTLLGAVRHKGFIPWDDDIDTAMLRDDYEKIIDAFKKSSRNPDIYACYFRNTKNCFIKIRHKKCQHLFVDIFPWDKYGKRLTAEEQLIETKNIKKIREKVQKCLTLPISNEKAKAKLVKEMHDKVLTISDKDEFGDYVWGMDFCHHWKNWFTHYEVLNPIKTINFEGIEFPCLNNPHSFLTRLYGNYMEYPPKITMGHTMYLNLSDTDKRVIKELKADIGV